MKILYINNNLGGFVDYIFVDDGLTVEHLFQQNMTDCKPEDYLICVNRQPVARDYVLQENDRVTISPTKMDGARLSC